MEASEVAEKLRAYAAEMRDAPNRIHTADALKLNLRRVAGMKAAKAIFPVWPMLNSGGLRYVEDWLIVLRAIRYTLDGTTSENDFDAQREVLEPIYGGERRSNSTEPTGWEARVIHENEMTEGERLAFYWDQAIAWAELLERLADFVQPTVIDHDQLAYTWFVELGATLAAKMFKEAIGPEIDAKTVKRYAKRHAISNGLLDEFESATKNLELSKRGPASQQKKARFNELLAITKANHNSAK